MTHRHRLKIGFGSAEITPNCPMPGYKGNRIQLPPEGEPGLECIAAFINLREELIGLVAIDTPFLSREFILRVREEVRLSEDSRAARAIIIAATHTHSAPPLAPSFLSGPAPDPIYQDEVVTGVLAALRQAKSNLAPARVKAGIAKSPGFEFNRRYIRKDGRVVMALSNDVEEGLEPCGPLDREIPFWWFESISGEPFGVIFSYPSHNNAARSSFFSPDISGYSRRAFRESVGGSFIGLMLQGACGDVAWIDPKGEKKGGIEHAKKIGTKLAQTILDSAKQCSSMSTVNLNYLNKVLLVPDRAPEESSYCDDGCRGSTIKDMELQRKRYEPEKKAVEIRGPTSCVVEINALILGDSALVTNPGELFSALGIEIRSRSSHKVTMVGELANGYVGYIPAEEDFQEGGYETHRTVFTSRLVKNAGRIIVESSLELLNNNHS